MCYIIYILYKTQKEIITRWINNHESLRTFIKLRQNFNSKQWKQPNCPFFWWSVWSCPSLRKWNEGTWSQWCLLRWQMLPIWQITCHKGYENCPAIGFIAHMDTVSDFCDHPIRPILTKNYNGEALPLGDSSLVLDPKVFPHLSSLKVVLWSHRMVQRSLVQMIRLGLLRFLRW